MPYRKGGSLPTSAHKCPDCGVDLNTDTVGENQVERCSSCRGLWVLVKEFNELLVDIDRQEAVRQREESAAAPSKKAKTRKKRLCPRCSAVMTQCEFGGSSGVFVDTCKKHGVWLDHGELRQVVDFLAERQNVTEGDPVLRSKGARAGEFTLMPRKTAMDILLDILAGQLNPFRHYR